MFALQCSIERFLADRLPGDLDRLEKLPATEPLRAFLGRIDPGMDRSKFGMRISAMQYFAFSKNASKLN